MEVFRHFFEEIVQLCVEAGLVQSKELYFDATKAEANASLDSTRSRSLIENRLEEHLAGIFLDEALLVQDKATTGDLRFGGFHCCCGTRRSGAEVNAGT